MRTLFALTLALFASPALAHPHIFIDATVRIIFNDAGEITAIRNAWTFDEAFSVWQVQGLDVNEDGITSSEEMQELADETMIGLAEYGFYVSAGEHDQTMPLASMDDASFAYENGRTTLTFGVEPQGPYRIRNALEVAVSDPEYYVAISVPDTSAITLENAPAGCIVELNPPREMSDEIAAELYALPPDVTRLPPELEAALRGVQGAIIVTCPPAPAANGAVAPGEPASALDAATALAAAPPAPAETNDASPDVPFGGPPAEPGFSMPQTGLFGWIAEQQRTFYRLLTDSLGALREDNNAFWVLGGLSFLYGIFHAAGPGHGKVVISSYVLASERTLRRGIALSFAAAMVQSAVAIALVLVAVGLLNLTAAAMSDVANWIGIVSYALVALLGLWLIARQLFGWGHSHRPRSLSAAAHAHVHDHDHAHDHHHDRHDHAHHHVVTADATRGTWRQQLGVVLAVGLRPCSGALIVLAFALSQGVLLAGIIAVLLMGLGTAITVAVLASVAVGLKGAATAVTGGGTLAATLVWWAELAGAVLVFAFGALLLLASL